MNIKNLLVALLVLLTQLQTSVAQTPLPPDARVGPPQFAHGTKLMYAPFSNNLGGRYLSGIPDGSILKWLTVYYSCGTNSFTIGRVPYALNLAMYATPYGQQQIGTPFAIYTQTSLLPTTFVITDVTTKVFVSDELTFTLDFYNYVSYELLFGVSANDDSYLSCSANAIRIAYLPPIVGINAYLPSAGK